MKRWFMFNFDTGELEYIGRAEDFSGADELTGGRSGWVFDTYALEEFVVEANRLLEASA